MKRTEAEFLDSLLTRTNDWLKYADGKIGALIAVNSLLIVGVVQYLSSRTGLAALLVCYLSLLIFFCGVSLILCLVTYSPRLNNFTQWRTENVARTKNILYFGDVATCTENELSELFAGIYHGTDENPELRKAYFGQLLVNSRIAVLKFRFLKLGVFSLAVGVGTPLSLVFLYFLNLNLDADV